MRFRNAARDVRTISLLLTQAEAEARKDGQEAAGAEHLLLSAFTLPDATARRAFERAGYDPDSFRGAIARQYEDALTGIGIDAGDQSELDAASVFAKPAGKGPLRTTATAQRVFQSAVEMARLDGRAPLVGAYIVLAVTELQHGTAARALQALGVDRDTLAAAARAELV